MLNGKPTLTFGDDRLTAPSRKQGGRSVRSGAQPAQGNFASYLPVAEKTAGQKSPPALTPSMTRGGEAGKKGGMLSTLSAKAPTLSTQNARPLADSVNTPASSAPVQSASVRKEAQPAHPIGKQNFFSAREEAQRRAELMSGQGGRPPARRLSGQPVTGRGGIGMEDTRKNPQSFQSRGRLRGAQAGQLGQLGAFRQQDLAPVQNRSINYSLNAPGFTTGKFSGMDLSSSRSMATLAKVMEADNQPLKTLNSMAAGTAGALFGLKPTSGNGLGTTRRERPTGFAPLEAPLLSGSSTKSLVRTFQQIGGGNDQPIGALAAKFESGAEGSSAIGYDRHGGTSYGKYQISSRAGTMKSFVSYLEDKAPDLARRLASAGPANTGSRQGKMPDEWKKIAGEQAGRFEELQGDFIRSSHFEPAMEAIEESTGVAFNNMPPALQEVLFSTAVQHGPSGAARIVSKAVNEVGAGKLTASNSRGDTFKRAGQELIKEIYSLRAGQFMSSTSRVQSSVRSRLKVEMQEALSMLA